MDNNNINKNDNNNLLIILHNWSEFVNNNDNNNIEISWRNNVTLKLIFDHQEADDDMCESLIQAPDNLYVKKCVANLIDTCPPNFADKRTARKCAVDENTTLYRYRMLPRVGLETHRELKYRNRHCAICNQVPESSPLNCTSALTPGDKKIPPKGIPPFSVILDLNTGYKIEQENDDTMQVSILPLFIHRLTKSLH